MSSTQMRRNKGQAIVCDSTTLSPTFVKLYEKFEETYLEFRKEANGLVDGKTIPTTRDDMVTALKATNIETRFQEWRKAAWQPLGAMVRHMSDVDKMHHINYVTKSQAHLHCQESPFCWRIIQQPEGYVGDAEMMKLLYRDEYEGATPFGMLVHKNSLKFQASQAVRNRKEYLKHVHIASACKANEGGAKVLSMAAGPAIEIFEFMNENPTLDASFLALDHDIKTIRKAQCSDSRLQYGIANAFSMIKGNQKIAFPRLLTDGLDPQDDFKGLKAILAPLKYKISKLADDEYDLVYSAGLYDYITTYESKEKGTKALTRFLFSKIRPGGKLVIGNFNPSIPDDEYFGVEIFTDWSLIYRDDEEMLAFLDGLPAHQIESVKIDREATGINSFLVVQKAQRSRPPAGVITDSMEWMKKRVANLYLIGIPLIGSLYLLLNLQKIPLTWVEHCCFLTFYATIGLSVGLGFHRCFTHHSFLPIRQLKIAMLFLGSLSLQGSVVRWVADHRRHHRCSDKEWDPHSPCFKEDRKLTSLIKGIFHAHFAWMFDHTTTDEHVYAKDLLKDPDMLFFDRYYYPITLCSFILPALFGYLLGGPDHVLSCLLIGGALRTTVFHNVTWSVNSFGHVFGSRDATEKDESRNNLFLAILTFGEGWHNNHHAIPSCAINQWKWYQIDMGGWILVGLEKAGLVSKLRRKRPSSK